MARYSTGVHCSSLGGSNLEIAIRRLKVYCGSMYIPSGNYNRRPRYASFDNLNSGCITRGAGVDEIRIDPSGHPPTQIHRPYGKATSPRMFRHIPYELLGDFATFRNIVLNICELFIQRKIRNQLPGGMFAALFPHLEIFRRCCYGSIKHPSMHICPVTLVQNFRKQYGI